MMRNSNSSNKSTTIIIGIAVIVAILMLYRYSSSNQLQNGKYQGMAMRSHTINENGDDDDENQDDSNLIDNETDNDDDTDDDTHNKKRSNGKSKTKLESKVSKTKQGKNKNKSTKSKKNRRAERAKIIAKWRQEDAEDEENEIDNEGVLSQMLGYCESITPKKAAVPFTVSGSCSTPCSKECVVNAIDRANKAGEEFMSKDSLFAQMEIIYEKQMFWGQVYLYGIRFEQNPNDAIQIAGLLYEQQPDVIIETGTYLGASAMFYAAMLSPLKQDFRIMTMDPTKENIPLRNKVPLLNKYITYLEGSGEKSSRDAVREAVEAAPGKTGEKKVFVILDGSHFARDVYHEMVHFGQYVPVGGYMLVEDTRLSIEWNRYFCSESVYGGPCNGPMESVNHFMENEGKGKWVIEREREYLFTTHPRGFLKRIAL